MNFLGLLEIPGAPLVYDIASFPFVALSLAITKGVLEREESVTVLDVGSGTGNAAWMLGSKFKVTSVEPSPRMREWARVKGVDSVEGRVQGLSESLGTFDAVLASFLLRHLQPEDLGVTLTQLDSHVLSGGLMVLTDLLLPLVGPQTGQRQFLGVWTLYNPHSLVQEVEQRGYTLQASYFFPLMMTLVLCKRD